MTFYELHQGNESRQAKLKVCFLWEEQTATVVLIKQATVGSDSYMGLVLFSYSVSPDGFSEQNIQVGEQKGWKISG